MRIRCIVLCGAAALGLLLAGCGVGPGRAPEQRADPRSPGCHRRSHPSATAAALRAPRAAVEPAPDRRDGRPVAAESGAAEGQGAGEAGGRGAASADLLPSSPLLPCSPRSPPGGRNGTGGFRIAWVMKTTGKQRERQADDNSAENPKRQEPARSLPRVADRAGAWLPCGGARSRWPSRAGAGCRPRRRARRRPPRRRPSAAPACLAGRVEALRREVEAQPQDPLLQLPPR